MDKGQTFIIVNLYKISNPLTLLHFMQHILLSFRVKFTIDNDNIRMLKLRHV